MERPILLPTKLLLLGAALLAVIIGPILYLFPNDTATYFAWTIKHPLTPVFMGASYFTGVFSNTWASQINRWSVARVQFPAIIMFAITQLIATLLHLPIFNWSHPMAWAWLVTYITSPIVALAVFILNERGFRSPPPSGTELPRIFKPFMLAYAILYALVGLALFIFPEQVAPVWPWSLTPLTGRVIGGWYLAAATLSGMLAQQRTFDTAKVLVLTNIVVPTLLLLGALLHWNDFNGPPLSVGLYLLSLVLLGGFSLYAWLRTTLRPSLTEAEAVKS